MMTLFVWVIILFAVVYFIRSKLPFIIGRGGEHFVNNQLSSKLDPHQYKIINNILLPSTGNLNTTQIDHVIVSNYGVFCLETKAYKGWIFGDAKQEYWMQIIYHNRERFYNPLRQNYAHTKAIEELIKAKYPKVLITSFVAFPDANKLKISGTNSVGYTYEIINKIKNFKISVLNDSERNDIYSILLNANILDKNMRRAHIQDVRGLQRAKQEASFYR